MGRSLTYCYLKWTSWDLDLSFKEKTTRDLVQRHLHLKNEEALARLRLLTHLNI